MLLDNRKTKAIEVEVTQEDIDYGQRLAGVGDPASCALAQALMRQLGGSWLVDQDYAESQEWRGPEFTHDGGAIVYAFDHGEPITGTVRLTLVAR